MFPLQKLQLITLHRALAANAIHIVYHAVTEVKGYWKGVEVSEVETVTAKPEEQKVPTFQPRLTSKASTLLASFLYSTKHNDPVLAGLVVLLQQLIYPLISPLRLNHFYYLHQRFR